MSRKAAAKDKCVSADGHRPEPANGLTSIHGPIHCAATSDAESSENEQEQIDVDNFLGTLAQIALAVAAREQAKLGHLGEVGQ